MKIDIDDLNKTYDKCVTAGNIREKTIVDTELIKSLKDVAERGLSFIKGKSKDIPKNSTDWTFVFRDYYESLRELIEAFLLFDKVAAENHQCKNAYLCSKHSELDLDWNFLETARLKRNAINYRGQFLKYEDWSKFRIQFNLHISKLLNEIEERLKNVTKTT